ncbi:MAG TPA: hypothetical protein VF495_10060 [Phenylobacterium sp.]
MAPVRFEPDSAHEEHAHLPFRKQITARWLVARDFSWPLVDAFPAEILELTDVAHALIRSGARRKESLSAFLARVAADLKAQAEDIPGLPPDATSRLISTVGEIQCVACAQRVGGAPCAGGFGDAPNLRGLAACLEPISEVFRTVANIAEAAYGEVLDDRSEALRLRLVIEAVTGDLVTGGTSFPEDTPAVRSARIALGVPVETFDGNALGHAIYVLFHEVFVHGPEGWLGDGQRTPSNDRCALREGFVDAAGVHLFLRCLRDGGAPGVLSSHVERLAADVEFAHISRVHAAPFAVSGARAAHIQSVVSNRRAGRDWFETLEHVGWADRACRLAMCLNTLSLTPEQKGALIPPLHRAIGSLKHRSTDAQPGKYSNMLADLLEAADRLDAPAARAILEEDVDRPDF